MSLFKFRKNKAKEPSCACCAQQSEPQKEPPQEVSVLGLGCAKCNKLTHNTKQALTELGYEPVVIKVDDPDAIGDYGVLATPALAVGRNVLLSGQVPGTKTIKTMLEKAFHES